MQTVTKPRAVEPESVHVSEPLAEEAKKWTQRPVVKESRGQRSETSQTARTVRFDRD